jgi:hypothetical protein
MLKTLRNAMDVWDIGVWAAIYSPQRLTGELSKKLPGA